MNEVTPTSPACGVTYLSGEGEIASPGFPLPYPSHNDCKYVIKSAPGTVVSLRFTHMDVLDDGSQCSIDFVGVMAHISCRLLYVCVYRYMCVCRDVPKYLGKYRRYNNGKSTKIYLNFQTRNLTR